MDLLESNCTKKSRRRKEKYFVKNHKTLLSLWEYAMEHIVIIAGSRVCFHSQETKVWKQSYTRIKLIVITISKRQSNITKRGFVPGYMKLS